MAETRESFPLPEAVYHELNGPLDKDIRRELIAKYRLQFPAEAAQFALDRFDNESWHSELIDQMNAAFESGDSKKGQEIAAEIKRIKAEKYPSLPEKSG